jgi:hypothetical protein
MATIFAIDGAESGEIMDFGATSSAVAALQTALVALGQSTNDATLKAIVIDGLIGPKTTAATNRAFTMHIGAGQAPAQYRTGTLSQTLVAANAAALAPLVQAEAQRRGNVSTATVIATATPGAQPAAKPAPSMSPIYVAPAADDSSRATIIKWSAIGLGLVVAAAGIYYFMRRRGVSMVGRSFGDGERYKTFIRSATNWDSFARARKHTVDTGLTYDEARRACQAYNDNRSSAQIRKGTKMEFTRE